MNAPTQIRIGAMTMTSSHTKSQAGKEDGMSQAWRDDLRFVVDEVMSQRFCEIGPMLKARMREELEGFFDAGKAAAPAPQAQGGLFNRFQPQETGEELWKQEFVRREEAVLPSEPNRLKVMPSEAWRESAPDDRGRSDAPGGRQLARLRSSQQKWGQKLRGATKKLDPLHNRWRLAATRIVLSPWFDWTMCSFILVNAIILGIQTEMLAHSLAENPPEVFSHIESVFAVIFVSELCIRLFAFRQRFFYMPGYPWNIFDFTVVLLQVIEEILSSVGQNLSFARMLKLLRLVRALRIARVARLIRELRTLVISMTRSLKSLGWTCLLLLLMIYTMSIFLTQAVYEHRRVRGRSSQLSPDGLSLEQNYGALPATMFSLFQAISGGEDWGQLCLPMVREISWVFAILFVLYISFAIFALMNVVTGIFVDSVLLSAKQDKESLLMTNAREIFRDVQGGMDLQAFLDKVDTREMQEFFRGIDVDSSQAQRLFHVVDLDGSGEVDAEEFLSSCIRLNGPAKALDTAALVQEVSKIADHVRRLELFAHGQGRASGQDDWPRRSSRSCHQDAKPTRSVSGRSHLSETLAED